ncbi:MAG: hypothetical protein KDB88_05845 [Flavobacteriales bacterium]|nr:hypothetical protein [Flavobacteriales bacterium]
MDERFIRVSRTARYHSLGDPSVAGHIWIVLHGYGQLARYFLNKFEGLEAGLFIVAPEGLSRFYLDKEHRRVGATWMTREDRKHEIEDHVRYLDTLTDLLRIECPRSNGISVIGFSQGVATASRWTALGSARVQHQVLWGGSLPKDLSDGQLQERWSDLALHLVQGKDDELVPETVHQENKSYLDRLGLAYQSYQYSGGHELDPVLLRRLLHAPLEQPT